MKNYILILSVFAIAVGFTACNSLKKSVDTEHSNNISLDWQGVYTGVLPCADCEGIQTVIHLDSNSNYQLETTYLDKPDKTETKKGTFSWDKDGGKITLDNLSKTSYPVYYAVGENNLVQLDLKGNPITSELASKYILQKENNPIVEKYWKLVELNGRAITPPAEGQPEPHLILKAFNNWVSGNAGCNGFGGTYEELPGNRIKFSKIFKTLMACPNLKNEDELFMVLEKADNFSYSDDTMTLNKAKMAPLAKFVAVYF